MKTSALDWRLTENTYHGVPAKLQRGIYPAKKSASAGEFKNRVSPNERVDRVDSISTPVNDLAGIDDHSLINGEAASRIVLNHVGDIARINQFHLADSLFQPGKRNIRPAERTFAVIKNAEWWGISHDAELNAGAAEKQTSDCHSRSGAKARSVELPHQADTDIVQALISAIAEDLTMRKVLIHDLRAPIVADIPAQRER